MHIPVVQFGQFGCLAKGKSPKPKNRWGYWKLFLKNAKYHCALSSDSGKANNINHVERIHVSQKFTFCQYTGHGFSAANQKCSCW